MWGYFKQFLTFAFLSSFLVMHHWHSPLFIETYGSAIMGAYMVVDFICQPHMRNIFKLHHFLAGCLCLREMYAPFNVTNEQIRRVFIETEWSTIVLQCVYVWRNEECFQLLFSLVFVYCRVFKIAFVYMMYVQTWDFLRDIPALGLYAMNCHWFLRILEKYGVPLDTIDILVWVSKAITIVTHPEANVAAVIIIAYLFPFGYEKTSFLYMLYFLRGTLISYSPYIAFLTYYQWYHKKKIIPIKEEIGNDD